MSAQNIKKLLNACLLLSAFAGYLEWGQGNKAFLIEAEMALFSQVMSHPEGFLHPFVLLPLTGQLLLLFTLFQKIPGKVLTFVGMACIGALLGLLLVIGIITPHLKILASTLPFFTFAILAILYHRKKT